MTKVEVVEVPIYRLGSFAGTPGVIFALGAGIAAIEGSPDPEFDSRFGDHKRTGLLDGESAEQNRETSNRSQPVIQLPPSDICGRR